MDVIWNDVTSTEYWTPTYGSFNGTSWDAGSLGEYKFVSMTPKSWASGYTAGKIRLTYSLSSLVLTVLGSLNYVEQAVDSGGELDISSIGEMTFFQFGGTESAFRVTKIEIYGEDFTSEEEPEPEPVVVAKLGTSTSWGGRGKIRGYKHRPLKSRTR